MTRLISFLVPILFLALALAVGAVFRYPLVLDDPFITYRYAQNILDGSGMVFNVGERVLSTTTPLYAILLAAGGLVLGDLPALGYWLSVLCMGAAAWLLYLLGSTAETRAGGLLAGILFVLSPALVITFGLETGLYLLLGLAALYAYIRKRVTLAFALAALLTLTRSDGILLTAILGGHYLYARRTRLFPIRAAFRDFQLLRPLLVYAAILIPWLLFSTLYFGSPFPFTLAAKVAQAQSGLWDPFAVGFAKWVGNNLAWIVPLLLAAGVGAAWAIRSRSSLVLVGVWTLAHLLGYAILGVAFYAWYVGPVIPALALYAGIGVIRSAEWASARARKSDLVGWGVVVVACTVLIGLELRADIQSGVLTPAPKTEAYRRAAEWISRNAEPDATVDALEVGLIGFYDGHPTYDFVGLVDPLRVPYTRVQKFAEGVRRRAADYVIAIPPDIWLEQDGWFKSLYRPVEEIRVDGFYANQPLVIHQRADSGRAPIETRMVNAAFEKWIELSNVEMFTRDVARGDILPVRLGLRALYMEPVPDSWKFTLQLVGADDRIIAQSDSFYPARLPEDGLAFSDVQGIVIPPVAAPGEYELILAMYDVQNRERLSMFGEDGNEVGDFVPLGKIVVK